MTVLTEVIRSFVRCDHCHSAYIHAEGDVQDFITGRGWQVTYGQHICPRCARKTP